VRGSCDAAVEGLAAAKEALLTGFDMWASHQTQQAAAQVSRPAGMILRAASRLATTQNGQTRHCCMLSSVSLNDLVMIMHATLASEPVHQALSILQYCVHKLHKVGLKVSVNCFMCRHLPGQALTAQEQMSTLTWTPLRLLSVLSCSAKQQRQETQAPQHSMLPRSTPTRC
jgi:hypothetical protein